MAEALQLNFEPAVGQETSCIHGVSVGEYFVNPFNEDETEFLIRTASGATSICTGVEYPTELFEIEEEDEAEDDEYLLELVPAGTITLEIE